MCGLCGFSHHTPLKDNDGSHRLSGDLLKSVVSRGRDATGWAWLDELMNVRVLKAPIAADDPVWQPGFGVDRAAPYMLGHVRYGTGGSSDKAVNNHPIKHKHLVGTHNGVISNASTILKKYPRDPDNADAEVDSEAIWAAIAKLGADAGMALLKGTWALVWTDTRRPNTVCLARGDTNPLYVGTTEHGLAWASTSSALRKVYGGDINGIHQIDDFTMYVVEDGEIKKAVKLRKTKKANPKITYYYGSGYGSSYVYQPRISPTGPTTKIDNTPIIRDSYQDEEVMVCDTCGTYAYKFDTTLVDGDRICERCGGRMELHDLDKDRPRYKWWEDPDDPINQLLAGDFEPGDTVKLTRTLEAERSIFYRGAYCEVLQVDMSRSALDPRVRIKRGTPNGIVHFTWADEEDLHLVKVAPAEQERMDDALASVSSISSAPSFVMGAPDASTRVGTLPTTVKTPTRGHGRYLPQ